MITPTPHDEDRELQHILAEGWTEGDMIAAMVGAFVSWERARHEAMVLKAPGALKGPRAELISCLRIYARGMVALMNRSKAATA